MSENELPRKKTPSEKPFRKDGTHIQQKYSNQDCIDAANTVLKWLKEHEEAIFITEYFNSDDAKYTYDQFIYMTGKNKSMDAHLIYENNIKKIIEVRLVKRALVGTYKEGMAKFVLQNNFGWRDRVESDITVSAKPIQFKFGNPELNIDDTEDLDFEDLTDQKEITDGTE